MTEIRDDIKAYAWQSGELGYKLRNIQKFIRKEFYKSKSNRIFIECSRRIGKSTLALILLVEHCIRNPGSKAGFFAPVKEGLRDYVVPIYNEVFADCPQDLIPFFDSRLTVEFANGSILIFRGSNNQQHRVRRGNDFQIAAVDEARDVDDLKNLIDSVIVPALFSSGGKLIISSTPADTEDHPLKVYRDEAQKKEYFHHYSIYDANKYDPDDFPLARIEQWKKDTGDTIAWAREYLAEWVKDPSRTVLPEFKISTHVATVVRDNYFPVYHKYVSMDLGVRDKTAGIFGYYDFKQAKLIIEDEFAIVGDEVRTDKIAAIVKSKEKGLEYQLEHDKQILDPSQRVYRRIADNNNPVLLLDLNGLHNLNFYGTRKDELPAMVNLAREWLKDERVLIDPSCKELIGCLENGVWDLKKKELARSKVYGHYDALMAFVYLIRNIDTSTNPIPKFYQKSFATHAIPNNNDVINAGTARVLSSSFDTRSKSDKACNRFIKGIVNGGY